MKDVKQLVWKDFDNVQGLDKEYVSLEGIEAILTNKENEYGA